MRTQRIRGYTLIELLIVIAIASIFLQGSIDGLQTLVDKSRRTTAIQTAISALNHARSIAVMQRKNTGVCIIDLHAACNKDWNGKELMIFVDANKNWQYDDGEEIVSRQPWENGSIQLKWESNWRDKPIISYQSDGSVTSNGTLTLQKPGGEKIADIVISKPGRARIETDLH